MDAGLTSLLVHCNLALNCLRQEQEFPSCLSLNGPLNTSLWRSPRSRLGLGSAAKYEQSGTTRDGWDWDLPWQPCPTAQEATGGRKVNADAHHPSPGITHSSFVGESPLPSNAKYSRELTTGDDSH